MTTVVPRRTTTSKRNVTPAPEPKQKKRTQQRWKEREWKKMNMFLLLFEFIFRMNRRIRMYDVSAEIICANHRAKKKKERGYVILCVSVYTVTDALFIRRKILGTRRREGAIINLRERHREWMRFFSAVRTNTRSITASFDAKALSVIQSCARPKTFTSCLLMFWGVRLQLHISTSACDFRHVIISSSFFFVSVNFGSSLRKLCCIWLLPKCRVLYALTRKRVRERRRELANTLP